MLFTLWFIIVGALLIFMALANSTLKRLPLSTSMLYLGAGALLGPAGLGLLRIDPVEQATLLERLTEIALIISLFSAGLKLRTPLRDGRWRLPTRLAFASMMITVLLIAFAGNVWLGLPVGAAILLGAILAPTDPVLASDVQVQNATDQDRLRFSLTGEAGLNDGSAFPFVMLGLGLLGLHDIGQGGWRWFGVDVLWSITVGLGIGWLLGFLIGHLVLYLRREYKESVGLDDFLALGLIALSYGLALLFHAYGFLAVFAAGLALRRIEREAQPDGSEASPDVKIMAAEAEAENIATDPEKAPAYMAQAVLGFSEHLERIGEVSVVLLVGGMLSARYLAWESFWFVPLLFLVIRPVATFVGLLGSRTSGLQRRLIAWFGVRGIGSLYYLTYAIEHGLDPEMAVRLTSLVMPVLATSIIIHGISVTPLMLLYQKRLEKQQRARHITEAKMPS
ncbi:MAG: cation:proton antiporter [Ardenticatenales bacterium]|nr:cation:proton antiporter [Ardenticatenales bacterium]